MGRASLSDVALARPVTVAMLLVATVLLGAIAFTRLPLAFMPSDNSARLFLRAEVGRTAPEVLERDVIRPLEEQIAGLRDLRRIQTGSGSWGVRMNLEFRPGTDVDARKLELRDRVDRVRGSLPAYVQRLEIGTYTNTDEPMMDIRISSRTRDLTEDYYLIVERVVRPIERIAGVARVQLEGVMPHELRVALDPDAAARAGTSLTEVDATLRSAAAGRSLGTLAGDGRNPGLRVPASPAEAERFAELPVRRGARAAPGTASGTAPLAPGSAAASLVEPDAAPSAAWAEDGSFARLAEVARVDLQPEEDRRGRTLNGQPAINVEVFPAAGASMVDVSAAVQAAIAEMRADPALGDVDVKVFFDQGQMILDTLRDLRNTGIWGGLLGILVLFGFLHRWRTTVAASICIPVSVLAAGAVLFLRGEELNTIVLLGLVLGVGMFIDNAVVIVEAIALQVQRGRSPLDAAREGAREVGLATIASTLSSVIVFLPLVFGGPDDPMSTYLRPLGITFAIGLIASLVVSQTAVPLLMGHVLPAKGAPPTNPGLDRVAAAYARVIRATLRRPRRTIAAGMLLAATALYPATAVRVDITELEPKPNGLPLRVQVAGSRDFRAVGEIIGQAEAALLARKAELQIESIPCMYGDWGGRCTVYPVVAFQSEAESKAFERELQQALPDLPGVTFRLGEQEGYWRDNKEPDVVEFAIKGDDMGVLMELSKRVADHLRARLPRGDERERAPGTWDEILTPFDEGSEELWVEPDPDLLVRHGLTVRDVADAVALAFQGVPLGSLQGPEGEIRLRVESGRLDAPAGVDGEAAAPGLRELADLRLTTAAGAEVPLAAIARLRQAKAPAWVQRVDRQTEVRVKVRFFDEDARANKAAVDAALASFPFPPDYTWGEGTQWRKRKSGANETLINLGLCLVLVYAVMASLFESLLQPFAILLTCLLGAFGAPWAMWVTQTTVDTTALVGLFILIGIVVNNGIMLVDKVTLLRAGGVPRAAAIELAGRDRLRPILMTATTTILGLLPMLIHHPTLAGVYYHGIAIIIAGGLLSSTLTTLLVLPAVYVLFEDLATSARHLWGRFG